MLKTRVIPTLLWKNHGLVKGVGFDSWRRVGVVLPAIKVYNTREVDELILLDITATNEERDPDYDSIADLSSECFVPLSVGGGVRSVEHVRQLLRAGADKVVINTAAYEDLDLIAGAAKIFGRQCIIASIDVGCQTEGLWKCTSNSGGRVREVEAREHAKRVASSGAGEIMLTSIPRDGTMTGYDLPLIAEIAKVVDIPLIASGGAGSLQDFLEAIQAGASAVAAASLFHFTQTTPLEVKTYLNQHGCPTRSIFSPKK